MLTRKQIPAKIGGVRRSSAAMRQNIHEIACSIAAHAYEHGDVRQFANLYDAMSGLNREALCMWIKANGFAIIPEDWTHAPAGSRVQVMLFN